MSETLEWDQDGCEAQRSVVPLKLMSAPDETSGSAMPMPCPSRRVADATLSMWADAVDRLESARKASQNQLQSLLGMGALPGLPGMDELETHLGALLHLEASAVRSLERAMKVHPLGPWVARSVGIGEKQAARLLAALGDPAQRSNPSQLVAFCGLNPIVPGGQGLNDAHMGTVVGDDPSASRAQGPHGTQQVVGAAGSDLSGDQTTADSQSGGAPADGHPGDKRQCELHVPPVAGVARTRRRGQRSNWSSKAKSRLWLVAKQCVFYDGEPDKNGRARARSPYRDIYEAGREKYADTVHVHQCQNTKRPSKNMMNFVPNGCGTGEHPEWGAPGSPLRPGHQQARAMRLVMRAILIDLWVEAKRQNEVEP